MVTQLLKLNFLSTFRSVTRKTSTLVLTIIMSLYLLGIGTAAIFGITVGLIFSDQDANIQFWVVTLISIAWLIVPLLISGINQTLDLKVLSQYGLDAKKVSSAILLASLLSVAGIITSIIYIIFIINSIINGVFLLNIIGLLLSLCFNILVAKVIITKLQNSSSTRKSRERLVYLSIFVGIILWLILTQLGNIIYLLTENTNSDLFSILKVFVSFTPFGAGSSLAYNNEGNIISIVAQFLIMFVSVTLLWLSWNKQVAKTLQEPISALSTSKAESGKEVWNIFDKIPASPLWAVTARALFYWIKDARYNISVMLTFVFMLFPLFLSFVIFSEEDEIPKEISIISIVAMQILFFLLSASGSNLYDISNDGTAFSAHVLSGVSGKADRLGRAIASAIILIPATIGVIIVSFIMGYAPLIPIILLVLIAVFLCASAFSTISSAYIIIQVPQSGENPFKNQSGKASLASLLVFVSMFAVIVMLLPSIILGSVLLFNSNLNTILSLIIFSVLAVINALVAFIICLNIGSKVYEKRLPEIMTALKTV